MHFGTNGHVPPPKEQSRGWVDWLSNSFDLVQFVLDILGSF
jgi:hypothetical protein